MKAVESRLWWALEDVERTAWAEKPRGQCEQEKEEPCRWQPETLRWEEVSWPQESDSLMLKPSKRARNNGETK